MQIPILFLCRATAFQSKVNQMADAGLKWIIKKFCPDFTASSQIHSISHIPAGFPMVFTTILFFQWPAVRQFCRFQIMITPSTGQLAWWRWNQTTASCWVGSNKISPQISVKIEAGDCVLLFIISRCFFIYREPRCGMQEYRIFLLRN